MKITAIYILLLLLSSSLSAQQSHAQMQLPADSVRPQVRSAGDTLAAIHQLFLRKRRIAKTAIWTGVGLAVVGVLVAQGSYALVNSAKQATSGTPLKESAASVSLKFSLPGLAITSLGLIKRLRFNRQRQAEVISTYEQGKGLRPSIQRRIRSQHFATP